MCEKIKRKKTTTEMKTSHQILLNIKIYVIGYVISIYLYIY